MQSSCNPIQEGVSIINSQIVLFTVTAEAGIYFYFLILYIVLYYIF